jgi:hypothetical protein
MPEAGDKMAIPGLSCLSLREKSCWCLVCAPQPMGTVVDVALVTGRLMKPCLVFCAVNGREGLWQNAGAGTESLRVELRRNPLENRTETAGQTGEAVGNATKTENHKRRSYDG